MTQRKHTKQLRRQLRWAGISAAVLAAPAGFAQDCPKPSLEQCVDVDYRAGSCGSYHDAYCQDIVEQQWKAEWELAPKREALLPPELGGGVDTVATTEFIPQNTRFQGMDNSLMGQVRKGQILYQKKLEKLTKAEQAYLEQLQAWDKNGTQVTSCQEFVDEKYLDYSQFERKAGWYGDDFRALFHAAYDGDGIAFRTLYSKDQEKLAPIWGEQRVAKNAYFSFVPGPYPKGTEGYVFSTEAALLAQNVEAREWATASDEWHQVQSEQMSSIPDDVLNHHQVEQESFTALLQERASVYTEWQRTSAIFRSRDRNTVELDKQTAERLYGLDKAIEQVLVKAQKDGCLDAREPTVCDWSPRRYKTMLDAAMAPRREADLQACLFLTGNDFGPESFVRNAHKLDIRDLQIGDYTVNTALLTQYLEIFGSFIDSNPAPVNPPTNLPRHGRESSDSGHLGNNDFGCGYNYKAGWEFVPAGPRSLANLNKSGGAWCDSNIRFYAEFNAYANVFGPTRFEVAHLSGETGTEGNALRVRMTARVLGVTVLPFDQRYPVSFTLSEDRKFLKQEFKGATTFVIVFVPVTVQGGVAGSLGIKAELGGGIHRDCDANRLGADVGGTLTPYAKIEGYVAAGIGVPGLSVGVNGRLTLIDIRLPLNGNLVLAVNAPWDPTFPGELMLSVGSRLDLQLRTLDGSINLFGELGPFKAEFPIVKWTGLSHTWNIYDEVKLLPLGRVL